jgi:hypothetical protein
LELGVGVVSPNSGIFTSILNGCFVNLFITKKFICQFRLTADTSNVLLPFSRFPFFAVLRSLIPREIHCCSHQERNSFPSPVLFTLTHLPSMPCRQYISRYRPKAMKYRNIHGLHGILIISVKLEY